MRIRRNALVLMLVLVLSTSNSARAEYLDWSYAWSMVPPSITSKTGLAGVVGSTGFGVGTADPITAVTLSTFATSSSSAPEDVNIDPSPYDLTVKLQDTGNPGLDPVELTFLGTMSGVVSATEVNLSNSFASSFQTIALGEYLYKVTLTDFKSPSLESPTGSITAQISVEKIDANNGGGGGGGPVTKTPEPSSFLLAALVVPVVLWYRLRRQGQATPAPMAI